MSKPGRGIRNQVKKYSTPHPILRFDRDTTAYVDGILQTVESDLESINIHVQPIGSGDLIEDLPEGQRQKDVKRGWTIETISKKDKVIINDAYHTVNAIQVWPESGHTECDMIRTGEHDNIVE